jgi:hypothetical protein
MTPLSDAEEIEVRDPWTRHWLRVLGLGRRTSDIGPQGCVWLATAAELAFVCDYRPALHTL